MINTYMNYSRRYDRLIALGHKHKPATGYYEGHHIVPKSITRYLNEEESAVVYLTARQHYFAHRLLVKMYDGKCKEKMVYALWMMSNQGSRSYIPSRVYEGLRLEIANLQKHANKGRKHTQAHKDKIRETKTRNGTNNSHTPESLALMIATRKARGNLNTNTPEAIAKRKATWAAKRLLKQ